MLECVFSQTPVEISHYPTSLRIQLPQHWPQHAFWLSELAAELWFAPYNANSADYNCTTMHHQPARFGKRTWRSSTPSGRLRQSRCGTCERPKTHVAFAKPWHELSGYSNGMSYLFLAYLFVSTCLVTRHHATMLMAYDFYIPLIVAAHVHGVVLQPSCLNCSHILHGSKSLSKGPSASWSRYTHISHFSGWLRFHSAKQPNRSAARFLAMPSIPCVDICRCHCCFEQKLASEEMCQANYNQPSVTWMQTWHVSCDLPSASNTLQWNCWIHTSWASSERQTWQVQSHAEYEKQNWNQSHKDSENDTNWMLCNHTPSLCRHNWFASWRNVVKAPGTILYSPERKSFACHVMCARLTPAICLWRMPSQLGWLYTATLHSLILPTFSLMPVVW